MKCKWHTCSNEVVGQSNKVFCGKKCKNRHDVDKRRRTLKIKSVEYLGGECARCGWNEHVAGLVPHHFDPSTKSFALSAGGHTRSWDRIKEELDKCILLCQNCHSVVHVIKDPKWLYMGS